MHSSVRVLFVLLAAGAWAAPLRDDTARLASHLQSLRNFEALTPEQYKSIQTEYLAWFDTRIKAGETIEQMNQELQDAGLIAVQKPNDFDLDFAQEKHAGFLGELAIFPAKESSDAHAFKLGIHTGVGCLVDETLVIYSRAPARRLAVINADVSLKDARYLSGLVIGSADPQGRRMIATGWYASWCTSNVTSARLKLDFVQHGALTKVLTLTRNAMRWEDIGIELRSSMAAFHYIALIGNADLIGRRGIENYQIFGNRAIREAPIALSRAGFIDEWLYLDEDQAARWSTPQAVAAHHRAAEEFQRSFDWERIAKCDDSTWEIGIRPDESKAPTFFRVRGEKAADLKMLAVTTQPSSDCQPVEGNIDDRIEGISRDLPFGP